MLKTVKICEKQLAVRKSKGLDDQSVPFTIDATVWATEWIKVARRRKGIWFDKETMITWFANAIMAGFDEGSRREYLRSLGIDRLGRKAGEK